MVADAQVLKAARNARLAKVLLNEDMLVFSKSIDGDGGVAMAIFTHKTCHSNKLFENQLLVFSGLCTPAHHVIFSDSNSCYHFYDVFHKPLPVGF